MADEDYDVIIAAAAAASAAAAPLLVVSAASDAPVVAAVWSGMIYKIARGAGHELDREAAGRLSVAVVAGAGTYWAGSKLLGVVLSKIPLTMAPAVGTNALLNAVFTLRLGHALADLMERPEFDVTDWRYLTEFLMAAMRPRPSVEELQRAARLLRRLGTSLAG